jgi:hypothetical protein
MLQMNDNLIIFFVNGKQPTFLLSMKDNLSMIPMEDSLKCFLFMDENFNTRSKESWEQSSHVNLTTAVPSTPKLRPETDSQPQEVLENL